MGGVGLYTCKHARACAGVLWAYIDKLRLPLALDSGGFHLAHLFFHERFFLPRKHSMRINIIVQLLL